MGYFKVIIGEYLPKYEETIEIFSFKYLSNDLFSGKFQLYRVLFLVCCLL